MPRYSRSQLRRKLSQQIFSHDAIYCNAIVQSANNMTSQKIEREKRIANAAEFLQAIFTHSKIVPVGQTWKFDLDEYKLRNFGMKINFSKIRIEPVMLNFLAKTENLRNARSEQPIYNRGKVLEKSSGKLLFVISRYKSNASTAVLS